MPSDGLFHCAPPAAGTRLFSGTIARWSSGDEPDPDDVMPKVEQALEQLSQQLEGVPDALRDIVQ